MPDPVPAAAPPAPASPSPPAGTTPAAPPAATPATPAAAKPQTSVRRTLGGSDRRYSVKPASHGVPPKAATAPATPPAAPASPAATPAPSTPSTTAAAPTTTPDKPAAAPATTEAVEVPATPAATPEAAKLTEAEEAKRLARINRAEKQLSEKSRSLSHAVELTDQLAQVVGSKDPAAMREAIRRVQVIERARAGVPNKLEFIKQAFGWDPQALLDDIIGEGAKPESAKVAERSTREAAELRAKLAEIENQLQTSVQANQREASIRDVAAYKSTAIAPVLADAGKYDLTLRALGANAVDEVFALQSKRFQITQDEVRRGLRDQPVMLTPAQAADLIEKHFRSQRDLLTGTSVAPGTASTPRIEPAAAPQSGSQTQKPASTGGGYRHMPKPFTVKAVR